MKAYLDIGSTILKTAVIDQHGKVIHQGFVNRDYDAGISSQAKLVIEEMKAIYSIEAVRICSSANGGLRVGLIGLTRIFSVAVAKNLALAAGANVIFSHVADDSLGIIQKIDVDILVVAGGIDCHDTPKLRQWVRQLDLSSYSFQTLLYVGNRYLINDLQIKYPAAIAIDNPLNSDLATGSEALVNTLRTAYLEDLVDRQGIRQLHAISEVPIWPTPGVVSAAFAKIAEGDDEIAYPTPFAIFDIGGATTDVHFGRESLADRGEIRTTTFRSENRHVFTDLGVYASKASTETRIKLHASYFDLLEALYGEDASRKYADFSECEMPQEFLFAACLFLAIDAMTSAIDDGTPNLELGKLNSLVVTGGASQSANMAWLQTVLDMFLSKDGKGRIKVLRDENYRLWIEGLACLSRHTASIFRSD